jgi:uncharacterized membrane protein YgcG
MARAESEHLSGSQLNREQQQSMQPFVTINEIEWSSTEKEHVVVQLYDGEASLSATLLAADEKLCTFHHSSSSPDGLFGSCREGTSCKKIRTGLVILVRAYSFQHRQPRCSQGDKHAAAASTTTSFFLQVDDFVAVGIQQLEKRDDFQSADLSPPRSTTHQLLLLSSSSSSSSPPPPPPLTISPATATRMPSYDTRAAAAAAAGHNDDEYMSFVAADRAEKNDNDDADEATNNSDNWQCSHRLEHLAAEGVTRAWSVRAYVTAVSSITEFVRANNRGVGRFMRVQLRDTNAQLEMVVFEPYCNREPFTSLQLNRQYYISEGEIKVANSGMIKWPYEQLSREQRAKFRQIQSEIRVNKNTSIFLYDKVNLEEQSYVCGNSVIGGSGGGGGGTGSGSGSSSSNSTVDTSFDRTGESFCSSGSSGLGQSLATPTMSPPRPPPPPPPQKALVSPLPGCRYVSAQGRLRLSDVLVRSNKSLVTVLCVVCKMMPFNADRDTVLSKSPKYALQKEIAVRRLVVVDQSSVTVTVALWGDQAKYCSLEVGHCVLFKDVEVSNFGGFSLSVVQRAGIMCFGSCDLVEQDVRAAAATKKHSKASRIVECTNINDAYFQELAHWWQNVGSRLYRD